MRGISQIRLFVAFILASALLFDRNISAAEEINFSGLWTGTCFNKTQNVGADIEVELIHKGGNKATGHLKVHSPLIGSGPLEAEADMERERFNAKVRCKGVLVKLFFGGATIYLEDGIITLWPDTESEQYLIAEVKGVFRFSPRWGGDSVGVFEITKKIQRPKIKSSYPVFTTSFSNIYHRADCPRIDKEDMVRFNSVEEARQAGGVPCENCNP
ncbi:MAG: hypothetical protein ACE5IC_00035 [Candidatus Brocadiales bacterium]